jgi:DNA-binding MarR family transcriptional regulator
MADVPHPEADVPLLRLLGLAVRQLSNDLSDKIVEAGFADHRDSFHNVMPHVPTEGIRLTELAERAGMSKQAMAELVADAERLGYLQRSPDPTDGRAKIIQFSERGWKAVDTAITALGEIEDELTSRLGEPAVRRLRKILLDLLDRPAYSRKPPSGS